MGTRLLVSFLTFGIAACNTPTVDESDGTTSEAVLNAEIFRGAAAAARNPSTDEAFLTLAALIPGFAGLYFGEDRQVIANLTDLGMSDMARPILAEFVTVINAFDIGPDGAEVDPSSIVFVKVENDYPTLMAYRRLMQEALAIPAVNGLDLDELNNVVLVVGENAEVEAEVRAFAERHGIPQDVVTFQVASNPIPNGNLDDEWRPTYGGNKIERDNVTGGGPDICTQTVNANHGTWGHGMITCSHCTHPDYYGQDDGIRFAQAGGAWFWADSVGFETFDPAFQSAPAFPGCPTGYTCRKSDSAYVQYHSGLSWQLGKILRPNSSCSAPYTSCTKVVDVVGGQPNTKTIIGIGGTPILNTGVNKIGRTTGWTTGAITNTCFDVEIILDGNHYFMCNVVASFYAEPGDSGSPVFTNSTNNNVYLHGLFYAQRSNDYQITFYSPWSFVAQELGTVTTF